MYPCQDIRFVDTPLGYEIQIDNIPVIHLRLNLLNRALPVDFSTVIQTMLDLVFRIVAMSNEVLYDILIREDRESRLILTVTYSVLTFTLVTELLQNGNKPQENNLNATNEIEATANISADDYFSKSRLERDTMYSQMIESYENVLNGINALETQKQSASEEIKKINNTKNSIMICENLIATKGYNKCVVFVNGESVSAIIGAQELKQEEISQIQNILSRELNAKIENIHISLK